MGAKKGWNASTFADTANVGAAVREGREIYANTYYIDGPKGRSERVALSGAIAKIAILTPLSEGTKTA